MNNTDFIKANRKIKVKHNNSGYHWNATYLESGYIQLDDGNGRRYQVRPQSFDLDYTKLNK